MIVAILIYIIFGMINLKSNLFEKPKTVAAREYRKGSCGKLYNSTHMHGRSDNVLYLPIRVCSEVRWSIYKIGYFPVCRFFFYFSDTVVHYLMPPAFSMTVRNHCSYSGADPEPEVGGSIHFGQGRYIEVYGPNSKKVVLYRTFFQMHSYDYFEYTLTKTSVSVTLNTRKAKVLN